jgi:NUMOD4 motif-containing protein
MPKWRDIPGFHKAYKVSNDGQIRSVTRIRRTGTGFRHVSGITLRTGPMGKGYRGVHLASPGKTVNKYVHILVATAFIPNPKINRS